MTSLRSFRFIVLFLAFLWTATEAHENDGRRSASISPEGWLGYASSEDCLFGVSPILPGPTEWKDKTQGVKNVKQVDTDEHPNSNADKKRGMRPPAFLPKTTDI